MRIVAIILTRKAVVKRSKKHKPQSDWDRTLEKVRRDTHRSVQQILKRRNIRHYNVYS